VIARISIRRSPGLVRPGRQTEGLGVSGVRGDPSARKLSRWRLRRWLVLIQLPRIATLFQLVDNVIGDREPFVLGQLRLQPANNLAGPPQGEGEGVSKDFAFCHFANRTYREQFGKPLGLVAT
jgi:hypothetical protein